MNSKAGQLTSPFVGKITARPSTVRLTSIHLLQVEGNFTKTSGGSINLFYGCKSSELVLPIIKKFMAPLEVGPEFALN
jgi:hypothetical protein